MSANASDPRTRLVHQLIQNLRRNLDAAETRTGERRLVLTDQDLDMFARWPEEVLKMEAVV